MKKQNLDEVNIYNILEDYIPDDDLFSEEDRKINLVKHIIYDVLTESDRRIILLYTELGNIRDVGKMLKVSSGTAFLQIKRIQNFIKTLFYKYYGDTNNS